MKVSEICNIVQDCERLRSIILQDKHDLTTAEQQDICDLLWDYRCNIVQDCERLRSIILQDKHELTDAEQQEICDLLWDYRCELLKKEVK